MNNDFARRLPRTVFSSDAVASFINVFFSVASFASIGRADISVLGFSLDRGGFMGALFLLLVPAQWAIIRILNPRRNRVAAFFRYFHPQALLLLWFSEAIVLSQLLHGGMSHDSIIAGWDMAIFGFQPSIAFHEALKGRAVVELFFFGYFSYYALITTGYWYLFAKGRREEAVRCLFVTTAAFGVLLVWYVFFPVEGPKYYFPELRAAWYGNFHGYAFTSFMKAMFEGMNLGGAAFPSSHVAIAVVALFLNARYNRPLLPLFAPLTLLLCLSTVYIYAHYAVDVMAGAVAGVLLWALFSSSYRSIDAVFIKAGAACARLRAIPPLREG